MTNFTTTAERKVPVAQRQVKVALDNKTVATLNSQSAFEAYRQRFPDARIICPVADAPEEIKLQYVPAG